MPTAQQLLFWESRGWTHICSGIFVHADGTQGYLVASGDGMRWGTK
jgi:hypothetical protein